MPGITTKTVVKHRWITHRAHGVYTVQHAADAARTVHCTKYEVFANTCVTPRGTR